MDTSQPSIPARSVTIGRIALYISVVKNIPDIKNVNLYDLSRLLKDESITFNSHFYVTGKYGSDIVAESVLKIPKKPLELAYENLLDDIDNEDKLNDIQDLLDGKILKTSCIITIQTDSNLTKLADEEDKYDKLAEYMLNLLKDTGWRELGFGKNMFSPFTIEAKYEGDYTIVKKERENHGTFRSAYIACKANMLLRLGNKTEKMISAVDMNKAIQKLSKQKGRSLIVDNISFDCVYALFKNLDKFVIVRDYKTSPYNCIIKVAEEVNSLDKAGKVRDILKSSISKVQLTLPKAAWFISLIENKEYTIAKKPGEKNSFFFKGNRIAEVEVPLLANLHDVSIIETDLNNLIESLTKIRDETIYIRKYFKTRNQRKEILDALTKAVMENPILFTDNEYTGNAAKQLISEVTETEVVEPDVTDN